MENHKGLCSKCNKVIIDRESNKCMLCDTIRPIVNVKEGYISDFTSTSYTDLKKGMFDNTGKFSRYIKKNYAR